MSQRNFHDTDSPGLDSNGGGPGMGMSYDMLPPPLPAARRVVQSSYATPGYPQVAPHHGYMSYNDGGSGESGTVTYGGGSSSLHRSCKPRPLSHLPIIGSQQGLPDPNTSPRLLASHPNIAMRHVVGGGDPNHSPLPASPLLRGQQQVALGDVNMSPHPMSPHAINMRLADSGSGQQLHYSDPGQSPHASGGHYDLQPSLPAAASGHYGESCVSPHMMMHYSGSANVGGRGSEHHACSPRAASVGMHYGEPVQSPHARGPLQHFVQDTGGSSSSHYTDSSMGQPPGSAGHMTPGAAYADGSMHSPHPGQQASSGHPSSAGYHKQGLGQQFFAPNFTMPGDVSMKNEGGACMAALPPPQSQHQASSSSSAGSLRFHSPNSNHNDAMLSAINMSTDTGGGGSSDVLHDNFVPDAGMESDWGGGTNNTSTVIHTGATAYELFTPESEVNDAYKELLPDANFADAGFLGDADSNQPGGDHEQKKKGKGRPCKGTSPGRYGVQCPVCGKTFNNSSALAKHKLTHSEERKYICQLCQKAFKRQDHLNGHMMTHRSKKPYECKIEGCSKSYCDARSLRRHLENHHNMPTDSTFSMPPSGYHSGIDGGGNCMYYPTSPSPHTSPTYSSVPGGPAAAPSTQTQYFRFDGSSGGQQPQQQQQLSSTQLTMYQHSGDMRWPGSSPGGIYGRSGGYNQSAAHATSGERSPAGYSPISPAAAAAAAAAGHVVMAGHPSSPAIHGGVGPQAWSGASASAVAGTTAAYSLSLADPPKPVECTVCGRRFKNLPALNGHMRLHGGYMKKQEICDKEKADAPGGEDKSPPQFPTQQHAMSQQHQTHEGLFRGQVQHGCSNSTSESSLSQGDDASANRLSSNYTAGPTLSALSYSSMSAWQAATSLLSMGEQRPTGSGLAAGGGGGTLSSSSSGHSSLADSHVAVPSAAMQHHAQVKQSSHAGDCSQVKQGGHASDGSQVKQDSHASDGSQVKQGSHASDGSRVFNFPEGENHGSGRYYPQPFSASSSSAMMATATLPHVTVPRSSNYPDVSTVVPASSCCTVKAIVPSVTALPATTAATRVLSRSVSAIHQDLPADDVAEELSLADRKRHVSADPDKFTSFRHPSLISSAGFSSSYPSHSFDGVCDDTSKHDIASQRERRKSAEIPRPKVTGGSGSFREPFPWSTHGTGIVTGGGSRGAEGELFTRSDSAVMFRNPSTLPAKGKRKNRPEPLVILHSTLFQSRLRSPCTREPENNSGRCNNGTHKTPPPYTPPPILSPVRSGSGLFWSMSGTYRPVTPQSAAAAGPMTPKAALLQRQRNTSSSSSTGMALSGKAHAIIEEEQEEEKVEGGFIDNDNGDMQADDSRLDSKGIVEDAKTMVVDDAGDVSADVPELVHGDASIFPVDTSIRPHVNLGPNYQAEVSEYSLDLGDAARDVPDHAGLLWDPSVLPADVTDADLQCFQEFACCAAIPGNGCNKEYAMHLLLLRDGSIPDALLDLMNSNIVLPKDHILASYKYQESEVWSREEIETFTSAILKCDKDFYSIAKEMDTKDVRQCVEFYYLWKKVCPDEYRRLRIVRRRRENDAMYNLRSRGGCAPGGSAVTQPKDAKDLGDDGADDADIGAPGDATSDGFDDSDEIRSEAESMSEGAEATPNNYACDHDGCSATFSNQEALDGHMNAVHIPMSGSGTSAAHANSSFAQSRQTPSKFVADSAGTLGGKASEIFPCKLCGKVFNKIKSRSAHMKSHRQQGEKASSPALSYGHSSKKTAG